MLKPIYVPVTWPDLIPNFISEQTKSIEPRIQLPQPIFCYEMLYAIRFLTRPSQDK